MTVAIRTARAELEAAVEFALSLLDDLDAATEDMEDGHDVEAVDEREPEDEGAETWGEGMNQLI